MRRGSPEARQEGVYAPTTQTMPPVPNNPARNNLAELYRGPGKYAEAEPLYQRLLPIRANPGSGMSGYVTLAIWRTMRHPRGSRKGQPPDRNIKRFRTG